VREGRRHRRDANSIIPVENVLSCPHVRRLNVRT